jgi:hypothetical protein
MSILSQFKVRRLLTAMAMVAGTCAVLPPAAHAGSSELFVQSAVEHPDNTVTLPLYLGTSRGRSVWYVILDSSDGKDATRLGVNTAPKLANAYGTNAVQKVTVVKGAIDFPASVDFTPARVVVPGPTGFPPNAAQPGSIGEVGYSPLIQLPDGIIRDAPQIANDTGMHDKIVSIDKVTGKVTLRETDGFSGGKPVKYLSTDSSDMGAAALEASTYAPALNAAPFPGGDGTDSSRASLAAFVNGQTGAHNPERQGLNSALLDGLDPLNVLAWTPNQGRYSPLWDVHATQWSAATVARGENVRQTDFGQIKNLAQKGIVTSPGGAAFGPAGFIVNCPIISKQN